MEGHLRRAQSQDGVKRRVYQWVDAAHEAATLVNNHGWRVAVNQDG